MQVIIDVRVVLERRTPETGGLADVLFIRHPQRGRRHEGLVVEARRHELAAQLADLRQETAHQVLLGLDPAADGVGFQAVVKRLLGGTHVGHLARFGAAQLQDGVGLFGTGGDQAPRTRILEAGVEHIEAVGHQRRGEGIACQALITLAIEGEGQRRGAIDASTRGETARGSGGLVVLLAHALTPLACVVGSAFVSPVMVGCSPMR